MKLFEGFDKIEVKDMFVGEIFDPQAYMLDKNGQKTGATKAISLGKFDVATKNEDGDYVSVVDGTVYSDGSQDKIVAGKTEGKLFFWNVESFSKLTGKSGKISKRVAAKEAKAINEERTQSLGV